VYYEEDIPAAKVPESVFGLNLSALAPLEGQPLTTVSPRLPPVTTSPRLQGTPPLHPATSIIASRGLGRRNVGYFLTTTTLLTGSLFHGTNPNSTSPIEGEQQDNNSFMEEEEVEEEKEEEDDEDEEEFGEGMGDSGATP